MVKCAVIADDLTGANATGVMLKKQGYVTSTIMNLVKSELSNLGDCECIAFTTDSRGVDGETAYNRVYNLTKMLTDLNLTILCKRIDSTLRGNLGCETDAALDAMGPDYVAVVVTCAPASGRITVGGYMQVNGTTAGSTVVQNRYLGKEAQMFLIHGDETDKIPRCFSLYEGSQPWQRSSCTED